MLEDWNNKKKIVFGVVLIILLSTVGIFLYSNQENEPAKFKVENLRIEPAKVQVGETTEVKVTLRNIGGTEGSKKLELEIEEKTRTLTIPVAPNKGKVCSFLISKQDPGVYDVSISGMVDSFRVTEKENIPVEIIIKNPNENLATVTNVVDGDTIDVRFSNGWENRVRLLGVDTPESYGETTPDEWVGITSSTYLKEWGENAKNYTNTHLLQENIILRYDNTAGKVGYYGRLLAYTIIDNKNFNLELVSKGYARAYTESDCKLLENLIEAEEKARKNRIGVWSIIENQPKVQGVHISNAHYDAEPSPERDHLDDEYIVIANGESSSIDMSGWILHDEGKNYEFLFPDGFSLGPGAEVTIYTGVGSDSQSELWWGLDSPVWNNSGDTAFLKNSQKEIVDNYSWG